MKIRNTFIIFIVSGFWHGANWTFIIWGALNAIYFLPLLLLNRNRQNLETVAEGRYLPTMKEAFNMLLTFGLTVIAWIFFRAESVPHALHYLSEIFSTSLFTVPKFQGISRASFTLFLVSIFLLIEWQGRTEEYAIAHLGFSWKWPFRYALYYSLILAIVFFSGQQQQFIYFQF